MNNEELFEMATYAANRLEYNKDSGVFLWKPKDSDKPHYAQWNPQFAGKEAGTIDDKGYRRICFRFKGKTRWIRLHRLAWFVVHGTLPNGEIDHIDQNKLNNSIANLRDVSKELNQRNATLKSNNTSGVSGVSWHKQCNKWYAQVKVDGKRYPLGLYDDISEAERVVKEFRSNHGFTETHGRVA